MCAGLGCERQGCVCMPRLFPRAPLVISLFVPSCARAPANKCTPHTLHAAPSTAHAIPRAAHVKARPCQVAQPRHRPHPQLSPPHSPPSPSSRVVALISLRQHGGVARGEGGLAVVQQRQLLGERGEEEGKRGRGGGESAGCRAQQQRRGARESGTSAKVGNMHGYLGLQGCPTRLSPCRAGPP